jgi:hypothetical protein
MITGGSYLEVSEDNGYYHCRLHHLDLQELQEC